jgi:hypothetical protein
MMCDVQAITHKKQEITCARLAAEEKEHSEMAMAFLEICCCFSSPTMSTLKASNWAWWAARIGARRVARSDRGKRVKIGGTHLK